MARYLDLDLNFIPHPVTGDIVRLKDVEAVKRAVRNLILMSKYDKPFNPEIDSGVRSSLFENLDVTTAFTLRKRLTAIIQTYEPRANLLDLVVVGNPNTNRYEVTILFAMANVLEPISLSFALQTLR